MHGDVYGLSVGMEKKIRKEKTNVEVFWEALRCSYKIPPEQGQFPAAQ